MRRAQRRLVREWFPLYAQDWLADEHVLAMPLAARGFYIGLLCVQWREGSIPADAIAAGRLVGVSPEEAEALWEHITPRFKKRRNRRVNPRQEHEGKVALVTHLKRRKAGTKGSDRRWREAGLSPGQSPATAGPEPGHAGAIHPDPDRDQDMKKESVVTPSARPRSQASNGKPTPTERAALETWFAAAFWPRYPLKKARVPALAAVLKLNPDPALRARILVHLAAVAGDLAWVDKDGRRCGLRASTYLHQERWNDGDDAPDGGKPAPAFQCRFCGTGLETETALSFHERDVCPKRRTS